jgi:hypothetical protein
LNPNKSTQILPQIVKSNKNRKVLHTIGANNLGQQFGPGGRKFGPTIWASIWGSIWGSNFGQQFGAATWANNLGQGVKKLGHNLGQGG